MFVDVYLLVDQARQIFEHESSSGIETDSFVVMTISVLWQCGGLLSNWSEFHHGCCEVLLLTS